MPADQGDLTTEQVLRRDIPWETYTTTKLISGTGLQLLRRYDKKPENYKAQLLDDANRVRCVIYGILRMPDPVDSYFPLTYLMTTSFTIKKIFFSVPGLDSILMCWCTLMSQYSCKRLINRGFYRSCHLFQDGPAYIHVFVSILQNIFKEETVEYVLALIDEMLSANPKRARLFHDKSLANEDTYEPFLRLLWKGNWFAQEKSCKILALIVSSRSKSEDGAIANGASKKITTIDDVLKGLVEWLCAQLKKPSHPSRGIPTAINCLATLLKEPVVRSSFVQADGVKFLIPLITPASSQQSIQLLYETCLCVWLLSFYEPAVEQLATSRFLSQLIDVVKGTTKEKVVRVVILTFKNLLNKGTFAAQMVDLEVPQVLQNLKAQAWSDEDLLEALNQLEEGLKDNIKRLSSYDKYYQEVILGRLDWAPMHKDPMFWKENITRFEEQDFKVLRILLTILDTSSDPRSLAVACYDLSQFIQFHPAGRVILTDLKAKDRVMKLMNHENAEVTKNALLCIQRLFLGAKYASFLQ